MWYKVKDASSAIANVDDYSGSAKLLAATTLRNVLGTRNLGDILSERESIAQEMEVKKPGHILKLYFVMMLSHPLMRQQIPGVYKWNEWK